MKITLLTLIFASFFMLNIQAQDDSQLQKKGFVIIAAGKNYESLKTMAQNASDKLGYKLNLRGLQANEQTGLSFEQTECENQGFEFPTYVPRGRFDDGLYVSIEHTDAYEGFTPDYYILVVASYEKGNVELKNSLEFVKQYYKTAYIKYADVYIGCMH